MRLVASIALLDQAVARFHGAPSIKLVAVGILGMGAAILLFSGLWTPAGAALAALVELWNVFSHPGDTWISILLGTLVVALGLLGPGAWSVDARLFGWKRIDIQDRQS